MSTHRRVLSRCLVALGLVAAGCGRDLEPAWGFDAITIAPARDGRITGFQAWQIYGDRWVKRQSKRHYICGVLVTLDGTPDATSCDDCTHAWRLTAEVVDTDCDESVIASDALLSLRRLAIGPLPVSDKPAPYDGLTVGGYGDYGFDWEEHGWAYPEALDVGRAGATGGWDGTAPYALWPLYAVPLFP